MQYGAFLEAKTQLADGFGFEPDFMPKEVFGFQEYLIRWACLRGRAAIFADCGMGKSLMELVVAQNVVRRTNKHVLILTPICVGYQMIREAHKFGIEAVRSGDGKLSAAASIVIANYERLHFFHPDDFALVICDESSILKNPDGVTRAAVTEFMRTRQYRLLCTATAAPNDYIELGTSSEALGELGFMDMLGRFFKKNGPAKSRKDEFRTGAYRFRGHAERDFWRWVTSWARAIRKPSDLGFPDEGFTLPPMEMRQHVVQAHQLAEGMLLTLPAFTLSEQRDERRRTLRERCEKAAELAAGRKFSVAWCKLNSEGDLLEKLIPDCVQVCGDDSEERKDEVMRAFEAGQIPRIVTKPEICGFGMNWMHCAHSTVFPSHSFEELYQLSRRFWRFGQKNPVTIDIVSSEGESRVINNLQRKTEAADKLFAHLVELMNDQLNVKREKALPHQPTLPTWLS